MKSGTASRTAEYNAIFRALETGRPKQQRLFEDRLAVEFLTQPARAIVRHCASSALFASLVGSYIDWRHPGVRASVVARTRLIDDLLVAGVREDFPQVLILGAGFDARAYRIPGIERLRVIEVDHPDTSAAKRNRLRRALGRLPVHVRYGTIDFGHDRLSDALARAEFDATLRTICIWEGVSNYLTEPAVTSTLDEIGRLPAGSRIVFTYVHKDILQHPDKFPGGAALHRKLAKEQEPLTFGLDPADVAAYLRQRGLQLVDDTGSVEYRARYMGVTGKHLRGHEFYRIAVADVIGGPRQIGGRNHS